MQSRRKSQIFLAVLCTLHIIFDSKLQWPLNFKPTVGIDVKLYSDDL